MKQGASQLRVVWVGLILLLSATAIGMTDLTPEVLIRFEIGRLLEWDKKDRNPLLEIPTEGGFKAERAIKSFIAKRTGRPAAEIKEIRLQDLLEYLAALEAEKKSLSAEEAGEWIAILRAQNVRIRSQGAKGDIGAELKKEVDKMATANPGAGLSLPASAKSALQNAVNALPEAERQALGDLTGNLTPKQLADALKNPKVMNGLSDKNKADLLGATRIQAPNLNPGFINSLNYDVGLDAFKRNPMDRSLEEHLEQLRAQQDPTKSRVPLFNSAPPRNYQVPEFKELKFPQGGGKGSATPKANSSPQHKSPSPSGAGSGSPMSGAENYPREEKLPRLNDLKVDELAMLEKSQDQKRDIAQNFEVKFANGLTAGCQLTWVKKEKIVGSNNFCHMVAATATHCSRGRGGVTKLSIREQAGDQLERTLKPIDSEMGGFQFINDPSMGDMGLVYVAGSCDLVDNKKIVPLAETSASANDPIWLEKKTNQVLNARVWKTYPEDPSMTLVDFRVAANSGAGVIEGDSGGPVIKIEDGQPRLTGVISARFTSHARSQIGLITSGDALGVARDILNQMFSQPTDIARVDYQSGIKRSHN